jgi:hypothetical protein
MKGKVIYVLNFAAISLSPSHIDTHTRINRTQQLIRRSFINVRPEVWYSVLVTVCDLPARTRNVVYECFYPINKRLILKYTAGLRSDYFNNIWGSESEVIVYVVPPGYQLASTRVYPNKY